MLAVAEGLRSPANLKKKKKAVKKSTGEPIVDDMDETVGQDPFVTSFCHPSTLFETRATPCRTKARPVTWGAEACMVQSAGQMILQWGVSLFV
jgi:hypothetical protein